jgi:hypothetical protein
VTVAHLHAFALATISTLLTLAFFEDSLRRLPTVVNPVLSIFAGTFLGFVCLGLWRASGRVPRTRIQGWSRVLLVLSGLVSGPALFVFVAVGLRL